MYVGTCSCISVKYAEVGLLKCGLLSAKKTQQSKLFLLNRRNCMRLFVGSRSLGYCCCFLEKIILKSANNNNNNNA